MSWNFRRTLLLSTVFATPVLGQVHAQNAPATASRPGHLEEVVITAQKRRENPMKTAVAITVLSASAMKDKDVNSLESLAQVTPSFTINQQGPTDGANIRGVGLEVSSPNVAAGVPIYRDGLYQSPLLPGEPLYDMASAEILRGPQGTLVGANSTGGAVFFNTVDPQIGKNGGYIEFKGGTYIDIGVQGAVNLPINDVLAARVAFNYETRGSYWKDINPVDRVSVSSGDTSEHPGNLNQKNIRLGLLYRPNGSFSVLIKTNYQGDDTDGVAVTPQPGTPASYQYLPSEHFQLDYPDPASKWTDYQSRTSVEAKYNFNTGIVLRSVSGFNYTHEIYNTQEFVTTSPTTAVSGPFGNHIEDHILTQEFNLLSPASDRLHWVVGSYSQYWPAVVKLSPNTNGPIFVEEHDDKYANALFGEVGYNFTPIIEVHAGLRYAIDRARQTGGVFGAFGGPEPTFLATEDENQNDDISSGRIGTDIKISPTQFAYLVAAKGAKTGGVNGPPAQPFAPEAVYDYEGGLKSTWLDGQLRTTIGGFYMDYKRLQLSTVSPRAGTTPGGGVANAGSSTIDGAEFSTQGQFGDWGFDGNLGYVHSSVSASQLLDTFLYQQQGLSPTGLQCAPGQTSGCFNYTPYYRSVSGAPNPYSPTWTGTVGVQYLINLGEYGTLTPRINFSYSSVQWATVFQNSVDKMQARHLLGAHLTYEYETYKVTLYGTNLTNEYYITGNTASENFYGAPREVGVRVDKTF